MVQPMIYQIGQTIEDGIVRIIGFELSCWSNPLDWIYYLMVDGYPFDVKVEQAKLIAGVKFETNGAWIRVLASEKTTTQQSTSS